MKTFKKGTFVTRSKDGKVGEVHCTSSDKSHTTVFWTDGTVSEVKTKSVSKF